jgi:tetratricopeptide (TPR) repeat protein
VDVLDLITSLVEKSLLRVDETDDGARYRMLETIRDYAREKLIMRDEQTSLGVAHADYFFAMAKAANRGMEGPEEAQWTRQLEQAHDDMRAAIARALEGGVDPILSVRLEVALMGFWLLRGYVSEGRNYVRASLALPAVQASEVAHGHALYVGAALADSQGFHSEAQRMLSECLALRRKLDNSFDLAATLSTRAVVLLHAGQTAEARSDESEAVAIFRELEHRVGEAMGLLHLGQIDAYVGNDDDARRYFEQGTSIAREIGYAEVEGECELMLGQLELNAGDLDGAVARFERSLEVCRESDEKRGQAAATWWLGKVDLRRGDLDSARLRLNGALHAFHTFEMNAELIGCLEDFGELISMAGAIDKAVGLIGAAASLRERLGLPRSPRAEAHWTWIITRIKGLAGEHVFQASFAKGGNWPTGDAVAVALGFNALERIAA